MSYTEDQMLKVIRQTLKMNEYNRRWKEEHKDGSREYHHQYYRNHKDEWAEYYRQYDQERADEIAECNHRYYQEHKTEMDEHRRRYGQTHRTERLEYQRQYYRKHPEKRAAARYRRLAQITGSNGNFTAEEFKLLCEVYAGRCAYCGLELPLGPDHKIPLSRGGSNSIDNIVPSCRPCNLRKYTMTCDEFMEVLEAA